MIKIFTPRFEIPKTFLLTIIKVMVLNATFNFGSQFYWRRKLNTRRKLEDLEKTLTCRLSLSHKVYRVHLANERN